MKSTATTIIGAGAGLLFCLTACKGQGLATHGSGGTTGYGGALGSGGSVGDATGAGGGQETGGALGSGGKVGSGGSGGSTSAGGVPGSGGATGAGGAVGSGGATSAGGSTGSGGATSAGGSTGSGGKVGSGGATSAGGSPGSGGSTGQMCGGIAGLLCPTNQFCELPAGQCTTPDISGTCTNKGGDGCPAIYQPVCGCDGNSYPSDCDRRMAGVSKSADGACQAPSQPCPTDISQINTWTCTEGLTCEFGTDPRPSCRDTATCTNGAWTTTIPALCSTLPPVTCPATRDDAAGQSCPTDGAYCTYDGLNCACTNCTNGPVVSCGGALTWHCDAPNADPACPAAAPLLGTSCSSSGQTCTYACGATGGRVCKQGAWYETSGGSCPVSTRRAKKDIVYLAETDRKRIADDLARFKLATYEYRDPALAGRRHLCSVPHRSG